MITPELENAWMDLPPRGSVCVSDIGVLEVI